MAGSHISLLLVLEFVGIVLSGVFGVVGVVGEFRNKRTGTITRHGKMALALIVLSSSIAATAQVVRTLREQQASELQSQKTDETLADVKKALHPLGNVFATVWIGLPLDDDLMKEYRE